MDHTEIPTPPASQLSSAEAKIRARQIIDAAYAPTSHRDDSPLPAYGPTPPVAQPGRPPMSQRATDVSTVMLAGGAASLMTGVGVSLVLWRLAAVDPLVLAVAGGAPVALLMALSRVLGRARSAIEAAPATHHHHYQGPVQQETTTVSSTTRGLIARTRNDVR
ncbi:hypothetical protein [Streptomyces sp. NPDC057496]|uniref:hypothetical protein n=1 Tax=Streptomyces sp. NPDC057496 TaxID=3346149 RepID=UPI0036CD8C2C